MHGAAAAGRPPGRQGTSDGGLPGCGRNTAAGVVVVGVDESVLRFQKRVRKITPKILQLLTEWTETFPYDFRDERMMRSLKELTHRLASGEEVSPAAASW